MNDFIRNTSMKKPLTDSISSISDNVSSITNNVNDSFSGNTNKITSSILDNSSTSKSSFSMWNIIKYILIIVIIIFLGINIFSYLGKNDLTTLFNSKNNEDQNGLNDDFEKENTSSNNIDDLDDLDDLDDDIDDDLSSTKNDKFKDSIEMKTVDNHKKITALDKKNMHEINNKRAGPIADDTESTIQSNKTLSKSGFCYVGEYKGVRSCINVGQGDKCMSGDIFPTKDICINPNLRQ